MTELERAMAAKRAAETDIAAIMRRSAEAMEAAGLIITEAPEPRWSIIDAVRRELSEKKPLST